MVKPGFQHPSMSITEEEEPKYYTNPDDDLQTGTGSADDDATGSDQLQRRLRRRRPSLSAEVRWQLDQQFPDAAEVVGGDAAKRTTSATINRKSVNPRLSRRKPSLFDLVQKEEWFRRISLPSWAMAADWESVARRQGSTSRRRTSLQVPSATKSKRHSVVALSRWRQQADREMRTGKLSSKNRFRRVSSVVLCFLSHYMRSHHRLEQRKWDVLPAFREEKERDNSVPRKALFDVSHYRARREQKLSTEGKKILSKASSERTEQDLEHLAVAFRWNQAFTCYPKKMQRLLCRAAWYERFEAHRTIVHQGDRPMAVYFILNGSVVVTIGQDEGQTKTLNVLRLGNEFGEDSIVSGCKRPASVISQTDVELLVISAKDFEDIFMAEGVKKILGSDYDSFLGNIPFLKGWPVNKLSENPSSCMFHYFNPGQVIVRDSNDSDWIYIVKSGSVSVMKKLRQVSPRRSITYERQLRLAKQGVSVDVPFRERRRRRKLVPPLKLPEVPRPTFQSQFELKMKMDETIPGVFKENDRLGLLDYDTIVQEFRSRLRDSRAPEVTSSTESEATVVQKDERLNGSLPVLPEITKTTRGVYMSAHRSRRRTDGVEQELDNSEKETEGADANVDNAISDFRDVTSGPLRSESPTESVVNLSAPSNVKPTFILVQVLEKGQYFGVGDVVFRERQPSLSVVSNGAECLLVSKPFFRQHSTESIINNLRRTEVPYPSDNELQEKLQEHTDWLSYRSAAYSKMIEPMVTAQARRRQYTTNYRGQYNHRTGPA